MSDFYKLFAGFLQRIYSCFTGILDNWIHGWLDLLNHPWYLFFPPIDIPGADPGEKQLLYALDLVLGPLDDFTDCIQAAVIDFGANIVLLTVKWPKEFNTWVIKLNDAGLTALEAVVDAATTAGQLPEFMSSLINAQRLASWGPFKLLRNIWRGKFVEHVKRLVINRIIRLWITIFRVGVTVSALYLIHRMRAELSKPELWTRRLQQNNPIVKDKDLGYRRSRE